MSRVTYSCSWAPNWPLAHTKTLLSVTATRMMRMTVSSCASGDCPSSSRPNTRSCSCLIFESLAGWLNRRSRNGISNVRLNTSRTAAAMLQATVAAMRHECGRANARSRRYITVSPPWSLGCQQRNREDALFRRHAAMEERPAISALIFAQLGGIDEEPVRHGQQRVGAESAPRQPQQILVRK